MALFRNGELSTFRQIHAVPFVGFRVMAGCERVYVQRIWHVTHFIEMVINPLKMGLRKNVKIQPVLRSKHSPSQL